MHSLFKFSCFFVLFSSQAFAFQSLNDLFEQHFQHGYERGYCGENSLNFIRKAESYFHAAERLTLVVVKNAGYSVFGLVNAEKARNVHIDKPTESNWDFHVFVIDQNKMVYDTDFDVTPRVIPLAGYIEEMFLHEEECLRSTSGEFCVGRDDKLDDYRVTIVNGKTALSNPSMPNEGGISLRSFLSL